MRIAINAALAGPEATGIGTYACSLARALPRVDGGAHEYHVFIGEPLPATGRAGEDERVHQRIVGREDAMRRLAWETWSSGRAAAGVGAQVLHSTSSYLPWPTPCPSVLTVHDLAIYRCPEAFRAANRTLGRWLFEHSLRRAAALIAPSQATRRDLIELLGVGPERIRVIPEAADELFCPLADPGALERVRQHYELSRPYVLSVGTAEPRKNLVRLLAAFTACRRALPVAHDLVLVGRQGWLAGPLESAARPLLDAGVLRILGYVPRSDLPALYAGAAAFAYPSLYEGFGLPVLEALACGAPVLTSNRSSLPEVAGDAGLMVDPDSVDAIATGLHTLLTDGARAAALRGRGLQRASQFSWDAAARATLDLYAQVAAHLVPRSTTTQRVAVGERSG